MAGVMHGGIEAVECDGLIAYEAGVAIHWRRVQASRIEVSLGAGDEESSRLIHRVDALEIHVTPIYDVEGAGFDEQQVQHIDIVHFAVGDVDEGGDRTPKIEQRVQLHRRFGRAKRRPREHRQAEIDSRGIKRYTVLANSTPKSSPT